MTLRAIYRDRQLKNWTNKVHIVLCKDDTPIICGRVVQISL